MLLSRYDSGVRSGWFCRDLGQGLPVMKEAWCFLIGSSVKVSVWLVLVIKFFLLFIIFRIINKASQIKCLWPRSNEGSWRDLLYDNLVISLHSFQHWTTCKHTIRAQARSEGIICQVTKWPAFNKPRWRIQLAMALVFSVGYRGESVCNGWLIFSNELFRVEWNINFNQMIAEQTVPLSCRAHIRRDGGDGILVRASSCWSAHSQAQWVSLLHGWSKITSHISSHLMRRTQIAFCCYKVGMSGKTWHFTALASIPSPQKIQFQRESEENGLVSKILWLRILQRY